MLPSGKELLVWYGSTYAEEIGIDVESIDQYKRKEDHTEEAVRCEYCNMGMKGEKDNYYYQLCNFRNAVLWHFGF